MKTLRKTVIGLACAGAMGLGATAAAADTDDRGWMPHGYGHMGMMGPGYGHMGMMGSGYGHMGTMGPGYGWSGHGPGWMMGPGRMMGPGMMAGPGRGWRHGPMMDPADLSDERLDRIGERIAERHQAAQEIAAESNPAARRELVREFLKDHWSQRWGGVGDDNDSDVARRGSGYRRGGMMGGGAMGPGMMGGGMMGPGMMGGGMVGPGYAGPGAMRPGMMYQGRLTEEQLDHMSEQMAENYERMEELAGTTDQEKRRELMREMYESMHRYRGGMY